MHYLRNAIPGCKISVEVEKAKREGLRDLASEADVVFYSKVWAEVRRTPCGSRLHSCNTNWMTE